MDPRFHDLQFLDEDEHRTSVKEALLEQLTEVGRQENELVMNEMQCDTSAQVKRSAEEASADIPGAKRAKLIGEIIKLKGKKPKAGPKAELEIFLAEEPVGLEVDPLLWWKINESRFPGIAMLAKKFLGVPGTSVPAEHVFFHSRSGGQQPAL